MYAQYDYYSKTCLCENLDCQLFFGTNLIITMNDKLLGLLLAKLLVIVCKCWPENHQMQVSQQGRESSELSA
jgi:hypothetical protein